MVVDKGWRSLCSIQGHGAQDQTKEEKRKRRHCSQKWHPWNCPPRQVVGLACPCQKEEDIENEKDRRGPAIAFSLAANHQISQRMCFKQKRRSGGSTIWKPGLV